MTFDKQLTQWKSSTFTLALSLLAPMLILVAKLDFVLATESPLNKFMLDTETKNNFKVFLTNMKVRNVPLAKESSENYLARLYKLEHNLKEDIEGLQKNLVLEDRSLFAEANVDLLKSTLEDKNHQLLEVQTKISETKKVIKDPKNSIMVPRNYGLDPAEQREREKEQLIRDRENSNYRSDVLEGKIQPSWLIDEW